MRSRRREFLRVGTGAAAGLAVGAGIPTTAAQGTFSITMQFSGLLVHGRGARTGTTPPVYAGWDALMVKDGHHYPELKIPVANIKNAGGINFVEDRVLPDVAVFDLQNIDLSVRLDGKPLRQVTATTGKGGSCPNPANPSEYSDIGWLADLSKIYGNGKLKPSLATNSSTMLPKTLITSRVRLPQGTISCAPPSLKAYEDIVFSYTDRPYPAQFTADLSRVQSIPASTITLDFTSMDTGATQSLELQSATSRSIFIRVENHDPSLAERALAGAIDKHNFWAHHFLPYHNLLATPPGPWQLPTLSCCNQSCDPPFYCVPPVGDL
jgi:hypothetical protein